MSSADSEEARRRLFLTNGLVLVTCLPPIVYGIFFAILGFYYLILLNLVFAGLFLLTLWFNLRGHRYVARFCLIGTLCLAIFSYSLILGIASGIYLVTFAVSCIGLVLFSTHDHLGKLISLGIPLLTVLAIFYLEKFHSFKLHLFQPYAEMIFLLSIVTTFGIIFCVLRFFMGLNDAYTIDIVGMNHQLESQNMALQSAYSELQDQRALLEKTWQEYGFTTKLSGTLRISEIVELTAKTILQHFNLQYVATVIDGETSVLHTWCLEDQTPVLVREAVVDTPVCVPSCSDVLLTVSTATIGVGILESLLSVPVFVLHLVINEAESRYIFLGEKPGAVAFVDTDINFLNTLTAQAVIALQRALPYEDAVRRYGLAIKQESAYQMLVSLQHQINSSLSAAKIAVDVLSEMALDEKASLVVTIGKEAIDAIVVVMRRMQQVSKLKEVTYLGHVKMWDIGDAAAALEREFPN